MIGLENLIPVTERTKEEARELAIKGGINSGKARREKKLFKEALKTALQMRDEKTGMKNILVANLALIEKAKRGKANIAEMEFIRDTIDGKLEETINVNSRKLEDFMTDD